ncbi:hypothetical protein TNCV_2016751 [Trichonephila clavipes]|nr:hypothetical protein TNCV_2016751 [Trichonephila clavipes]
MKAVRKTSVAGKRTSNLAFLAGHGYVLGAITSDKFPRDSDNHFKISYSLLCHHVPLWFTLPPSQKAGGSFLSAGDSEWTNGSAH